MATGSKGISYGGGNRGQATILGGTPTTMDIIRLKQRKKAQDLAVKKEKMAEFDAVSNIDPGEIRSTHTEYQSNLVNEFYDKSSEFARDSESMSDSERSQALIELNRAKTNIDTQTAAVNKYHKEEDKFRSEAKSNPHMNYENVDAELKRLNFDNEGNPLSPSQLDIRRHDEVMNSPDTWNGVAIVTDFKDSLEDSKSEFWQRQGGYDVKKVAESNLFKIQDGEVVYDEKTGDPVLNVTAKTLNLAKKDPDMARQIHFEMQRISGDEEREDVTEMEAFKSLIEPLAYKKESSEKKANKFALQQSRQRLKGKTQRDEANVFYQNLDTHLTSPQEDITKGLEFYIGSDGTINNKGEGDVLKPTKSQLNGVVLGKDTSGDKPKDVTIIGTYHDYNTGTSYYKTSNSDELKVLNRENAPDLVQQIVQHNPRYKGYVGYGRDLGYLGSTEEGRSYYNRKIKDSDVINKRKEAQVTEQKDIKEGIKKYKDSVSSAFNELDKASKESFWGFDKEGVANVNEMLSNIPKGSILKIDREEYSDPDITVVKGGPLGFQTDYVFAIDGVPTEIKANKEGFDQIVNDFKPTREVGSESKPKEVGDEGVGFNAEEFYKKHKSSK